MQSGQTVLTPPPRAEISTLTDDVRQLLQALPQPLLLLDHTDRIAFVNHSAELLLGVTADELLTRQWHEAVLLSPTEQSGTVTMSGLRDLDVEPTTQEPNHLLTRRDGSQRVVQLSDTATPAAVLAGRMITLRDCTMAWDRLRRLEHDCSRDHLTNLVNRREFEHRLRRVVRRARRNGSQNVLVFMDLDRFKSVNDENGHVAGDHVLREVAMVLAKAVRKRDTLARVGGDEFGLLMEHCAEREAVKTCNALGGMLRRHLFEWQGRELRIGISIGMVVIDRHSGEEGEMLAKADLACYHAKNGQTNEVRLYRPDEGKEGDGLYRELPFFAAAGSTMRGRETD